MQSRALSPNATVVAALAALGACGGKTPAETGPVTQVADASAALVHPEGGAGKGRSLSGSASAKSRAADAGALPWRPPPPPPPPLPKGESGGVEGGVEGGVQGGLQGGVIGGVEGGVIGEGHPDGSPPPPPEAEPKLVPHATLQQSRIAGETQIRPPSKAEARMKRDGRRRVIAVVKMCLDRGGAVDSLKLLRSSGYPAYDERLRAKMRAWKYSPFKVDGEAVPVCSVVTFIYVITGPSPT